MDIFSWSKNLSFLKNFVLVFQTENFQNLPSYQKVNNDSALLLGSPNPQVILILALKGKYKPVII